MPRKTNALLDASGTLKAHQPSLRERGVNALRQLLFTDDRAGQQQAFRLMDYADYTPVGAAVDAYDIMAEEGMHGAPLAVAMAGLPAPLRHGSPVKGLRNLLKSERGPMGPGVYSSPSDQIAGHYAGPKGEVYEIPDRGLDVYTGAGHRTDEQWYGYQKDKERLIAAAEPEMQEGVAAIVHKMWSGDGYPTYQHIRGLYGSDEAAQNLYRRAGFHGISGLVDGPETVLFDEQGLF